MDTRASRIFTVAGVTLIAGLAGYAIYFDYKRRNDVEFRKKLRKDKKRVDKSLAQSREALSSSNEASTASLQAALEQIRKEETPQSPEEKETYFMGQVSMGEQLSLKGPDYHLPAAIAFYRALRVYPSPVELIVIYQKTVPEPIFKLVIEMTNLDVSPPHDSPATRSGQGLPDEEGGRSPTSGGPPSEASSQEWDKVKARVDGYYEAFPPKSANVRIETRGERKVVVLDKDVSAGEVIYKEKPVVAVLDVDLQGSGKHCAHCFRSIEEPMSIKLPEDANPIDSTFCSKPCLVANRSQSHNLLFTREPVLPEDITPALSSNDVETRGKAQEKFVTYIRKEDRAAPFLVARFIARQVAFETLKMGGGKAKDNVDFIDAEGGEYLLADHLERLRYTEVKPSAEGLTLLVDVLRSALPGLEKFVTDERHALLVGKMVYNAFGVCFNGGRDDKPEPTTVPKDVERTRTPYGTSRQVGSAFYILSSYLAHSCSPSARPSFSSGTTELHLIANRDMKKGEELTIAYVDVAIHAGETVAACRRRRRVELSRGWRFPCACPRCEEEGKELTPEELKMQVGEVCAKDESKLEPSMSRLGSSADNDNVE